MRQSFVRVPLAALGAVAEPVGGCLTVLSVPGEDPAAPVVLTDLSPSLRTGFKGADTPAWLSAQGLVLPEMPNRTVKQADGSLLARLSEGEFLLLGKPGAPGGHVDRLNDAWNWEAGAGLCFPVPRQDSHCWFHLGGDAVPALFARLCAVDLRRHVFAEGAVAQTSVARLGAIIIRVGEDYHLLADSASAEYLWACLSDAMAEFDGCAAGAGRLIHD